MTHKMNPEVKKLWLEALRSGEYKQCKGWLHSRNERGDTYCCLGVLCALAVKHGAPNVTKSEKYNIGHVAYGTVTPYDSVLCGTHIELSSHNLPDAVSAWAEVDTHFGKGPVVDITHLGLRDNTEDFVSLVRLNDEYQFNFNQIADLIEAQL